MGFVLLGAVHTQWGTVLKIKGTNSARETETERERERERERESERARERESEREEGKTGREDANKVT